MTPPPGPTTLNTERLLLRPLRDDDTDAYAAMCADPEVMRYIGEGKPMGRDDAWRNMAMMAGHWLLRGFGTWAVEEKATGLFVGRVGLYFPEGWPDKEIGWTLAREHWGKGYGFEAAAASLDHAFGALGWTRAISLIDPDNRRSIRVAERLGERFEREIEIRGFRTLQYSIERETWLSSRPPQATPGPSA